MSEFASPTPSAKDKRSATSAPSVAVIGAGRMGAGIAHAFLVSGSTVTLCDVDTAATQRGVDTVVRSVSVAHERNTLRESPSLVLARLATMVGASAIGAVDLVIEAVPENIDLKRSVLADATAGVPTTTVVATNTSSISIAELADAVCEPTRFLGMHFFNPVPVSKLVELIRGEHTDDRTIELARTWVLALGKQEVIAADAPGFATSRLGVAIGLEAIRMLEQKVASAEDIDRGMVLGYGFPVGPLRLTDIVGLDVRLEIAEYLERTLGPRFEPPALLRSLVAQGHLGRKSGRGFYRWAD
ncbi:3-hydroxyacyl-CoA dehydrogenase family protein [Microcella sp.]|uniref:3-hydroxyacyl-CoA dehydrogenase family protein n=1 Tax=Microcella sp. TaxID=1913979 RepID=UPI002563C5C9|nr:3-hydroxyacyl-CoA dehydrogenase family protein [Microcella sp.]MBX9472355.1 3-hydroxyacyl-CoA dehydrogenase family protein [Microcella sp.]